MYEGIRLKLFSMIISISEKKLNEIFLVKMYEDY